MSVQFKVNTDALIGRIRKIRSGLNANFKNAMVRGMKIFEGEMIKEQLSVVDGGRHIIVPTKTGGFRKKQISKAWPRRQTNFGLRRITGTLARSWKTRQTALGVSLATSTPYARIHQFGGNTGRGGKTHIKKRLYIYEMFQVRGREIIKREIINSVFRPFFKTA